MLEKLKQLVNSMNSKGIPIPMVRDSKTGLASMTATMSVISFSTALLGQAGKIAGFLGGVDLSQANYLFLICIGAYLGRKMQGTGKDATLEVDKE
jgi:hypothetical protein